MFIMELHCEKPVLRPEILHQNEGVQPSDMKVWFATASLASFPFLATRRSFRPGRAHEIPVFCWK